MSERIDQGATKRVVFRAFLAADHVTLATGKTIAITISKNGGAFGNPAAGATNATAIASGFYYFDLGAGDTDTLGPLAFRGAEGTIDDVGDAFTVVAGAAVLASGAIGDTGNDTTHLHLPDLAYADDQINGHLLWFYDSSTGISYGRWVIDWVNSTKLATLNLALPVTPEDSADRYSVLINRDDAGAPGLNVADLVDEFFTELLSGHTTEGSAGKVISDTLTLVALVASDITTLLSLAGAMNAGIIYGAAVTGTLSQTQATTDLSGYDNDQLKGRILTWLGGDCAGEQTEITANTGGLLTFQETIGTPADEDPFKIT